MHEARLDVVSRELEHGSGASELDLERLGDCVWRDDEAFEAADVSLVVAGRALHLHADRLERPLPYLRRLALHRHLKPTRAPSGRASREAAIAV
eukprot:1004962-Pleurochrysis_carterae.AAC.8